MAYQMMTPRWPTFGTIVMLLLVAANVVFWYKDRLFPWQPYTGVSVISIERSGYHIKFAANFKKNECRFERLAVVGVVAGATQMLPWADLDGLPEQYDREAGSQTINIEIKTRGVEYDTIEIRTRHLCGPDDTVVDRIFASIDIASVQEEVSHADK